MAGRVSVVRTAHQNFDDGEPMPLPATRRPTHLWSGFLAATLLGATFAAGPASNGAMVAGGSGSTVADRLSETVQDVHAVRAHKRHRVAGAAAAQQVTVGTRIVIRGGAVTRRQGRSTPRPVLLAEQRGGTWKVIARTRTSKAGAWRFEIPAGQTVRTRTFRAQAPRFDGLSAATTPPMRVKVVEASSPAPTTPTPPPAPGPVPVEPTPGLPSPGAYDDPEYLPAGYVAAGTAGDWSYLIGGGSRWDPCQVIRWVYNPSGEGYPALSDVQRAFARISGISGLAFKYVGTTGYRYLGSSSGFPSEQAEITVGWADESELPGLAGSVVGIGGGGGAYTHAADVAVEMTRGYLTLDNGDVLPGGFDESGWGQVMLHEIMHALGLGHAREQVQVMFPMLTADSLSFGAGDISGLRRVGAPSGCL